MTEQSVQNRYSALLRAHVLEPEEKNLAAVAELGCKLVLAGVPEEEAAEIHEEALRRLAKEFPEMTLRDTSTPISALLIEMLMTYSLASREQLEERKRAEEELGKYQKRLEKLVKERTNQLEGTIHALATTVEMRDPYTAGHQRRVTELACAIAEEMGLSKDQIKGIHVAGLLHDIGKIAIPAEILTKPTKLTKLEFELITTHSQVSHDILKGIEFAWPVADIVVQHHERMDGSGYPNGLEGDEILREARIIAVADTVEAMASHRPYRPALGIDKALDEISNNKGVKYDPEVVDACLRLFAEGGFEFES